MLPFKQSGYNISNYFLAFWTLEEFYILLHEIRLFFNFLLNMLLIVNSM